MQSGVKKIQSSIKTPSTEHSENMDRLPDGTISDTVIDWKVLSIIMSVFASLPQSVSLLYNPPNLSLSLILSTHYTEDKNK